MKKSLLFTIGLAIGLMLFPSLAKSQAPTIEIGEGEILETGLPLNVPSAYSYSQSIYLQGELNIAGQRITRIAYHHNGGNQWSNHVTIYMGHTGLENLTAYQTEGLVKVFDENLFALNEQGWVEITLSTPFEYNNQDNLLIAIMENSSGSQRNSHFYSSPTTGTKSIWRSKTTSPPYDVNNPPSNGIPLEFRPNTRFWFEPIPDAANIAVFPSQLFYQHIKSNDTKSQSIRLSNTGTENLVITGFDSAGLPFSSNYSGTIAPGESVMASISFNPTAIGFYQGNVSFLSNAGNQFQVAVSGNAVHQNSVIEIFESTDFPPQGWHLDIGSWSRRATVAGGYTGPANAWKGSTAGPGYLATPKIFIQEGDVLIFYAYEFSNGSLTISYSSDLENWTELQTPALTTAYQPYVISLDAAAGAHYIGFSGMPQVYLDYIITPQIYQENPPEAATNPFPANEALNTFLTQDLRWAQSSTANGYKISLGTDNPPTNIVNAQDIGALRTFKTPALEYNTTYYWQVVPYNEFGDAAGCAVWSFTTIEYIPVTEFPFFEGFEENNGQVPPNGWINQDGRWTRSTHHNSGSYSARAPWNFNAVLITPPIVFSQQEYELMFYWKNGFIGTKDQGDKAIGHDTLYVEVSTNLGQSWQSIKALSAPSHMTEFIPVNVSLEQYSGQEFHIRFRQSTNGNHQYALSVAIDDIQIKSLLQEPEIWINMDQWNFNSIANNTYKKSETVKIMNLGADTLVVNEAYFEGDYFTTTLIKEEVALGFGQHYDFIFTFEPFETGEMAATYHIKTNGGNIQFSLNGYSQPVEPFTYEFFETPAFPPHGWMIVDADGDGFNWMIGYHPAVPAHNGMHSAISMSYLFVPDWDLTPDNWMITPRIHVEPNQEFSFWVATDRVNKPYEKYQVYLSTTTNRIDQFDVLLHEETLQPENIQYQQRIFDLSEYAGQQIHIAFRHHGSSGQYQMKIDDISIRNIPVDDVEAPYADPLPGEVWAGTQVSLYSDTEDAVIFYTLDGNEPDSSSLLFENPIIIEQTTTIKAVAMKNGHYSSIETFEYTINTTGIAGQQISSIRIFPNPASEILNIIRSNNQDVDINLYDINGQLVKHYRLNGNSITLNISLLYTGVYIIEILEKDFVYRSRFIVK
jgi:hypothetical protein